MKPPLPDIPGILRKYALKPNKHLGQNFLIDRSSLELVLEAAEILEGDTVLEIGPGLGSLTCLLASQARRVVAIELDSSLIPALGEVISPFENITLIQGDILKVNLSEVMREPGYLVVANIPYYITSAVIRILLENKYAPRRLVLTVQKEVADRICASPGDMSLLALSVQVYGTPTIAARIPAEAFFPAPKVDSAVVRVDLFPTPAIDKRSLHWFFLLAKAGFSQRRKTMRNALSAGMRWPAEKTTALLETAGINPMQRAETLSLQDWQRLTEVAMLSSPEQEENTRKKS